MTERGREKNSMADSAIRFFEELEGLAEHAASTAARFEAAVSQTIAVVHRLRDNGVNAIVVARPDKFFGSSPAEPVAAVGHVVVAVGIPDACNVGIRSSNGFFTRILLPVTRYTDAVFRSICEKLTAAAHPPPSPCCICHEPVDARAMRCQTCVEGVTCFECSLGLRGCAICRAAIAGDEDDETESMRGHIQGMLGDAEGYTKDSHPEFALQ